jgi:hypothetical protein
MPNKQLCLANNRLFNNSNIAAPGGTASLYLSGGLTPANFLDGSGIPLGPTITANGLGQLPAAYQDAGTAFRLILKDKNGTELDGGDIDPFYFGLTGPDASLLQPFADNASASASAAANSASAASASATSAANSATTASSAASTAQTAIGGGSLPLYTLNNVISVTGSASGASPNNGITINMPDTGTGQDRGVYIKGGTNTGSGEMVVLEKNRAGGDDFLRILEYSPTGFYYADNGQQTATHSISTRFGAGAVLETRKSIIISGLVNLNGTPADPANPAHAPTFVPPSALKMMLGINADVPCAFSTRLPDSTPDLPNQVHWSVMGYGGPNGAPAVEKMVVNKDASFSYIDDYIPDSTASGRPAKVLYNWGKKGRRGFGPFDTDPVAQRGALVPTSFTVADINGKGVDAYVHPNAIIVCPDATLPGLYYSNGFQWVHVADPTKIIGPDSFGWTSAAFTNGGAATLTATGTGNKTFTKTAGITDWDNAEYGTTTITGDQLIEFTPNKFGAFSYIAGFATAVPTASPAYGPTQGNIYGAYKPGDDHIRSALAGVLASVLLNGSTNLASIVAGDIIGLRLVYTGSNGTLTLEKNRTTVCTLSTTVPLVALRPLTSFNQVGGSVANFRWRSL